MTKCVSLPPTCIHPCRNLPTHATLQDLHVQLRQKNTMMKQMKMQIRKLNGTLPELIEKQPDDDDWAW